jgi:hypothetical protein
VHPITQPDDAFEALFADATLPADELAELRARRLSILDRVAGDLQGLGSTLPGEAADKVAIHLDLVRDLETKLQDDVALTCEPIGVAGGIDYGSNANVPLCVRRQVDVMVQALACGLTDVASLQLGNSGSGDITPLWDAEGIDINIDCHTIAHDYNQGAHANAVSNRIALETVFFDLFAYLLQQLDATPEGEGTMLDNSLVLWTKNLGFNHASKEMLYILAGGASGALETGRFLSFPGLPHNDLLASICQLMGMSDTTFGDPELCTGPLAL